MFLPDIYFNTLKAVAESKEQGNKGPFAYHNWVESGFVRFDGTKNEGSFIKELQNFSDTWFFIKSQDWSKMTKQEVEKECDFQEHTTYFRSTVGDEYTAYHGGRVLKDLTEEQLKLVTISKERHGFAFYMPAKEAEFTRTKELRLIVSHSTHPHNMTGKNVIGTWFPGTLANPNASTGLENAFVKFVWGAKKW